MRLYVIGASGGVGQPLVAEAIARGHEVTAHVRPSSPVTFPAAVRTVRRELLEDGALDAIAGHDAVLSCVGGRRKNPANPFSRMLSRHDLVEAVLHKLVPAMMQQSVARVLVVSAGGVGDSSAGLNWMMRALLALSQVGVAYQDLDKAEGVLASSSLDWLAVRPVTLSNKPAGKPVVEVPTFATTATISRADVGKYMLDRVVDKALYDKHSAMIANA
ncbi:MAG TPA: NAD(P)H-binding protein [Myxococcota bacterium]